MSNIVMCLEDELIRVRQECERLHGIVVSVRSKIKEELERTTSRIQSMKEIHKCSYCGGTGFLFVHDSCCQTTRNTHCHMCQGTGIVGGTSNAILIELDYFKQLKERLEKMHLEVV